MRVILVANPKGGSGKSTLSINLAGYLASAGRRVALLDLGRHVAVVQDHVYLAVVAVVAQNAVALAEQNRGQLNFNHVQIKQSDWFTAIPAQQFDVIVSNPPYIDPQDPHLAQGDVRFEPRSALIAANNGLADIELIIQQAWDYLSPQGWLLLEHGYDQAAAVRDLLALGGLTLAGTALVAPAAVAENSNVLVLQGNGSSFVDMLKLFPESGHPMDALASTIALPDAPGPTAPPFWLTLERGSSRSTPPIGAWMRGGAPRPRPWPTRSSGRSRWHTIRWGGRWGSVPGWQVCGFGIEPPVPALGEAADGDDRLRASALLQVGGGEEGVDRVLLGRVDEATRVDDDRVGRAIVAGDAVQVDVHLGDVGARGEVRVPQAHGLGDHGAGPDPLGVGSWLHVVAVEEVDRLSGVDHVRAVELGAFVILQERHERRGELPERRSAEARRSAPLHARAPQRARRAARR